MATTRFQRLAIQAAKRGKAAAAEAVRGADRLLKEARRRVTDKRTHRKIAQSLQKTGRVLKAASTAAVAAGSAAARAEMNAGKRPAARRARRKSHR
jgi:hypothetical protein